MKKATLSADDALTQLSDYMGSIFVGQFSGIDTGALCPGGPILPNVAQFGDFEIPYWWQAPGLIMYDVMYKGTGILVPIPSEARQNMRTRNLAARPLAFSTAIDVSRIGATLGILALLGASWWTGGLSLAAPSYTSGLAGA
ncbi:MAG: hypothetical protein RR893_13755 [Clostridia bacterium]